MDGSKRETRLLLLTCDPRQLSLRAEIERRHALRAPIQREITRDTGMGVTHGQDSSLHPGVAAPERPVSIPGSSD